MDELGAWSAYNIALPGGRYTMGPGLVGASELSVRRTLQVVSDVCGGVEGLRVLDLGCLEGLYAIEFALHGADVVAVEGREANIAKARYAASELGVAIDFVRDDLRAVSRERLGEFDVVLCLGVLYHLDPDALFGLVEQVGAMTRRMAVVETQISLGGRERFGNYRGHLFDEDQRHLWASMGNAQSLWPTKPSLLNLLASAGFTSVGESLVPLVEETARYRDHTVLVALKGAAVELRAAPQTNAVKDPAWPERMRRVVHPGQHRAAALAERVRSRFGPALPRVFRKS